MSNQISQIVSGLNRRSFTNNTQRVLHTLLTAPGDGWVTLAKLRVPSAGSRVRDLRKEEFGEIEVECASATALGVRGGNNTFLYRVARRGLTATQVRRVFGS